MKLIPPDRRAAVSALRVSIVLIIATLLPLFLYGSAPSWWSNRRVLIENAAPDDFAPANHGQLKNIAGAAVAEMDASLAGGAGDPLRALVNSWSVPTAATNDFAPLTLGQLKNVAKPFYERLIALGITDDYPWNRSPYTADDFAVANIGQVKQLFSFVVPPVNQFSRDNGDRIAAGPSAANLALEAHATWTWADRFGSGTDFDRNYPRRIPGLNDVSSVGAGERHLLVLHGDGSVSTWGENTVGQLGDGTYLSRSNPAPVPGLSTATAVKAGGLHNLVLLGDRTVLAWGDNYYGQLGTGDTVSASTPRTVQGLTEVIRIAAGYQRSIAVKADGTVWTWGYDHYNGQDIFSTWPIAVPKLTDIVDIAAGYEHSIALKSDGTVWAWGSNYANQIGNGSPTSRFQDTPVQVPNLGNIRKVASSYDHSLALASDGSVWAWGQNFAGQLGDGTTQRRSTPVQVVGLGDVVAIATAYDYSLAMKSDGTVWTWGDGAKGVLPGADLHIPQPVTLGLLDSNGNGIDDRWEIQFFGGLDQTGDGDSDGDRISNRQEYLRGTDPTDYFNGATPVIEIASGNNQIGDAGTFLSKPLKVRVKDVAGQTLVNAPVTFNISNGSGGLSSTTSGAAQPNVMVRTDADGIASTYLALLNEPGTSIRTTASAGKLLASAKTTFRSTARLAVAPAPTPRPDPSATPGPTPSPTATPRPPYRYVILDLGKDLYPYRINNQGQILMEGFDANGNWGQFRWNGGTPERLTYPGADAQISVRDMNDLGAVVGELSSNARWKVGGENELLAGLYWAPDQSIAAKISAHAAYKAFEPTRSGTFRMAGLTAINNNNELFGYECTGTVRGFPSWTLTVMNSQVWPVPPTPLSSMTATNLSPDSDTSVWQGTSDKISRANGKGHYIGTKFTPAPGQLKFMQGTETGMIDGASVTFRPVDINEGDVVIGYDSSGSMILRTPKPAPSPRPAEPPPPAPPGFNYFSIANTTPIAVNDHTRPAPPVTTPGSTPAADTPQPTPIPAPQILSWVGNALAFWELQPDGQTWHPFGLEEMIPSMDSWLYLEPSAMNDSGAIVGRGWFTDPSIPNDPGSYHAFLLVPVEIRDTKDPEDAYDDELIEWQSNAANIDLRSVAWIEPHRKASDVDASAYDDSDDPVMPQLTAQLKGVSALLRVEWRFRCTYRRPSGRMLPEDTVTLPADGSFHELTADKPWELYRNINEIPFFGGNCEVTFKIAASDGLVLLPEQAVKFRIGGKNPVDDRCRKYIDKVVNDFQPKTTTPMWYAYAIAKSETKDEGGETFYNQFLARGSKYARKRVKGESLAHYEQSKWDGGKGNEGSPNWNNDGPFGKRDKDSRGNSLEGVVKPGGYGVKQVTGWHGKENGDVPRGVIWNWKVNVDEGLAELVGHHKRAIKWMRDQRQVATKRLPSLTVGNLVFEDGSTRTMEDAVAIKNYNGSSVRPSADPDVEPDPRVFFYTGEQATDGHYCYWDKARNKWSLSRFNSYRTPFNYVLRVCEEVEQ